MQVKITGSRRLGNTECWLLSFVPADNLPVYIERFEPALLISKPEGAPLSFTRFPDRDIDYWKSFVESREVRNVGDRKFPRTDPPYGYPAYFLIPTGETDETYWGKNRRKFGKKREKDFSRSYRIAEKNTGDERHTEITRTYTGNEIKRIKQKWVKNAKWWSECEVYKHGYKRLHVWLKE